MISMTATLNGIFERTNIVPDHMVIESSIKASMELWLPSYGICISSKCASGRL